MSAPKYVKCKLVCLFMIHLLEDSNPFFKSNIHKKDALVDWSESGESVADGCAFRYRAKLPTGKA